MKKQDRFHYTDEGGKPDMGELFDKPLTAVPVPAKPRSPGEGEARESTKESAEPTEGKPNRLASGSRGGGQNILNGGVEKSHETRWQAGKDRPEASEKSKPNAQLSGSTISLEQNCGGSVPPIQNISPNCGVTPCRR